MELEEYLKKGKFYVWNEKFAVVKSKKPLANAFAVSKDKNEITCVIEQSKIKDGRDIINVNKNWKILTFDMKLPFNLAGFLAKVSTALARDGISIFVISSYSTDHILVKEKNLKKAINKLKSLGFQLK